MMRFSHMPAKSAARDVDKSPHDLELATVELAFLGSLLPGIIHNMATPLSGVLGATQLLEHRAEQIQHLIDNGRDAATERRDLAAQLERNRTNVEILSRNAQHLANILHSLVQRINNTSGVSPDFYPLNDLIESEVRFLDSNLQFKHRVKKELDLHPDLPSVSFVYGQLAALIDEFACYAITRQDPKAGMLTMKFKTGLSNERIELSIEVTSLHPLVEVPGSELLETYLARFNSHDWQASVIDEPTRLELRLACQTAAS
ncbi:hypothetical protein HZB60_02035 [candidate division KSB1 bacterium]|nr:hypothetical protein [candidate division KSB1 bacterium]